MRQLEATQQQHLGQIPHADLHNNRHSTIAKTLASRTSRMIREFKFGYLTSDCHRNAAPDSGVAEIEGAVQVRIRETRNEERP